MSKMQKEPDYPRGLTFEQVWAAFMEDREFFRQNAERAMEQIKEAALVVKDVAERQKETDRQMKETDRQMKETDRQMKETDRKMKETDRQMKETDRKIDEYNKRFGDFTNRFGEMVEHMIAPNLLKRFYEMGFNFSEAGPNRTFTNSEHNISLEVDVMLENNDKAMLVEVKTKLTIEHIKKHIKRLEKMRVYADLRGDKRAFLGAVAGVVMTPQAKNFALGQGLYLVEPSGETFTITPPSGKPREW